MPPAEVPMSNAILNGISSAVYRSLEFIGASADLAVRLRGRRPRQGVTWH